METEHYTGQPGKAYHLIMPYATESNLIMNLEHIEGLEGDPRLKFYIYIDDRYVYKSKTYQNSANPRI